MTQLADKRRRYPGIRAFERPDNDLFFGRDEEKEQIWVQVSVQPLTVVFAKSGMGKSSLINAGLIPRLEDEGFLPIKVRFQSLQITPLAGIKAEVLNIINQVTQDSPIITELNSDKLSQYTSSSIDSVGLWEFFKACHFERDGELLTPVLILDQFEEFFEHKAIYCQQLVQELADIVSERLPGRIRESLLRIEPGRRTQADLDWHTPLSMRVVMAIRSDRLSHLNELSYDIPSILQNRFQLQALSREQALRAIVNPAQKEEGDFALAPFEYDLTTLKTILDYLSNDNQSAIETFQLQLVCQHIETQLLEKNNLLQNKLLVDSSYLPNRAAFENLIADYYEKRIALLPDSDKEIARRFIEDALIVSGRRVGVAEVAVFDQYKISKELLDKLLDSRIIRAEVTHLGKGYELSHDTLVAPLSKLSEKHREKERERVLNRTRWALAGSSILVLFSLTALIVAIIFYKQAKTANNDANNRLKEALQEQIQRQELELKDLERKINTYKQSELNNAPIIQEIISLRDSIDLRKKDNELKIKYIDN